MEISKNICGEECLKIIKDFFGQEKIVYLEKKYIEKNDSKNNIKEFILNLKNSLIIKNNVEPLKEVAGILKLNDNINYEFLSDGEKYIINLFFSLIFSTKYSLLVTTYLYIIDEPELNLHIEWQQLLIKHIKNIIDDSREYDPHLGDETFNYIITTHSPYIVNYPNVEVGNPEYETE